MERQEQALDLVLEISTLLADDMRRAFERDGLTPARAHLLWVLQQQGPVSQRVLADALGVTPRTVTGLVDGLEESGLVVRQPHPTDRRSTLVAFTETGSRIAQEMATGKAELAGGLFGEVPARRLAALVKSLADVRDRLAAMVAEDLATRADPGARRRERPGAQDSPLGVARPRRRGRDVPQPAAGGAPSPGRPRRRGAGRLRPGGHTGDVAVDLR